MPFLYVHRCVEAVSPVFSNTRLIYFRITKKKKPTSVGRKQPPVASMAAVPKSRREVERTVTVSDGRTADASIPRATQQPPLVSADRDAEIQSLMARIDQLEKENLNTTPLPKDTFNSPDDDDDDAKMPATDGMTAPTMNDMPPNHPFPTGTLPTAFPTTVNGPSFASLPHSSANLAHPTTVAVVAPAAAFNYHPTVAAVAPAAAFNADAAPNIEQYAASTFLGQATRQQSGITGLSPQAVSGQTCITVMARPSTASPTV
jgi:hypothetical protein